MAQYKFPNIASIPNILAEGDPDAGYSLVTSSAGGGTPTVPITTMVLGGTNVLTSSIELVPANPDRCSLRITNTHASAILWLNFNDEPALANASYPLLAGKEFVYTSSSNGRWTGNVNAVVQSGSISVFFVEETAA